MLYGNKVFDLTKKRHPGGQYIWDKLYGRDISRFINGNHIFEDIDSFSISHEHSIPAINFLEKAYIGSIESDSIFISTKDFDRLMAPDYNSQSENSFSESTISSRTYIGEESDVDILDG